MEIIHVVLGKANPERMNGVNKVVYQLATRQKMAGKQVSVWGITHELTHNYPARNFETRLFRSYRNKFRLDPILVTALKEKKGKAVFHLHGGFNPELAAVARVLFKHQISYVFTPHGAYNEIARKRSRFSKKVYTSLFEKPLVNHARYIHCLGKSEVAGLATVSSKAQPLLVPYGFEMDTTEYAAPIANQFIIGFCGRLDIYTKGLDLLVKAFRQLKEVYPEAELWIIGDGKEKATLENRIAKEAVSGVILWGSKYGEEKEALLRRLHVFAHPSRNEGLPSSVLEAASFGVPCVVTEATNVGDAIRNNECGIVIDQPDAQALFLALQKMGALVKQGDWMRLSTNARKMVKDTYNWNTIIPQFDALYAF